MTIAAVDLKTKSCPFWQTTSQTEVKQCRFFGIITDECTDTGVLEQLSLCVRYLTDDLQVHEEWLCFENLANISAETIFSIFKTLWLTTGCLWRTV